MKLADIYREMYIQEYYEQNALVLIGSNLLLSALGVAFDAYEPSNKDIFPLIERPGLLWAALPFLHSFYVVNQTPGGIKTLANQVYNMLPSFNSKKDAIEDQREEPVLRRSERLRLKNQ